MNRRRPVNRAIDEDDHQRAQWRKLAEELREMWTRVEGSYHINGRAWGRLKRKAMYVPRGNYGIHLSWGSERSFHVRRGDFKLSDADITAYVKAATEKVVGIMAWAHCQRR